jgi:hypothetical protein
MNFFEYLFCRLYWWNTATYSSGYFIVNEYDSYGYLTKVTDSNNNPIWEAKESNAPRQLTKTQIGNKEKTYTFNNKGLLTDIICPGIMNLNYTFDGKGNVTYRTD